MPDDKTHQERLKGILHSEKKPAPPTKKVADADADEASCAAFGYLRGIRDRADAIEFRFRDGNSTWFSYGLLGSWQFNPSEGLLLKFSCDLFYLVLIRGSNLDKPLSEGEINLTNAGLQRHRVVWIREMTQEEIGRVGESGPTIDSIEIGGFTTHDERRAWLEKNAAAFLR
jgi:hypothetical protein